MRLLGTVSHTSDTTTTTNMLTHVGMTQPEIMTNVLNLFEGSYSTFSSFLTRMGMANNSLYAGIDTDRMRVVGNRKVMWPIKGYPNRKGKIISHSGGNTPGLNGAEFNLVVSTNWFSKNDNLELVDRRTLLHILSKQQTAQNQTTYRVKLVHNQSGAFCDPTLLTTGQEIGFGHTMFPELSEDAGEKTTYPEWHTEFLGIQRMKHTISGSAKASKIWLEHNGVKMWDYAQNIEMMERWAGSMEHQYLWGRATIDANDRVYVHDDEGRELPMGNGIIEQGDASLRFAYNNLSIKTIERVMENMQLLQTTGGTTEIAVCGGTAFYNAFQRLMRDQLQQNPIPLVEVHTDGNGKTLEMRTKFSYYTMGEVRLHVMRHPAFDSPMRPIERDSLGNSNMSERAFFCSMGNTIGGEKNVELIALGNSEEDRRMVTRIVNGMAGKGPLVEGPAGRSKYMLASSPVDGMQVHVLAETGVIMRNPFGFAQLVKVRRR